MKLKRISRGFYHAPEANKWITVCLDEKKITWHINYAAQQLGLELVKP